MQLLIILGAVSHLSFVLCKSPCEELKTCGACISYAAERCGWCAQDTMNKSEPMRCKSHNAMNDDWCPPNFIHDPFFDEGSVKPVENKPFSSIKGKEIQFAPQKIKVKLRPGSPVSFKMSYQPAKAYPLDMYFLMDNSYSMLDWAKVLSKETLKIYEALKNMTENNVRLGLGTFCDKSGLPYSDYRVKPTYSFKHHLSLTKDTELFQKMVKKYQANYGSNYDSPESTLDALMQVMTCQEEIGWKNKLKTDEQIQARRMIIVATDSTYHSAGDGRAIGAFKPNDLKCHLDSTNTYNDEISRTLDYPSVSQIKHVAKENNMIVVFTILRNVVDDYKALANYTGGKVSELKSKEIVPVIEEAYIKAARDVKLKVLHLPKSIELKTTCDTNPEKCVSTQGNPTVDITATITAKDCTSGHTFDISPFGIADKLTVEVEVICKCDCESTKTDKTADCSSVGSKQCGVCVCDPGRSGETCDITCSDANKNMHLCKHAVDDISHCNNRGKCICGTCECDTDNGQSYSGKFCEHDDALCRESCPADRGDCVLGECICKKDSEWIGPSCNCTTRVDTCIGPFSKLPCSGRGSCDCGKCTCAPINGIDYFGNYCEKCKDCAKELCEQLKDYAYCNFEKNAKANCDARYNQTSIEEVIFMNKTRIEAETLATGCKKEISGKNLVYKYLIIQDYMQMAKIRLMIQDELESPPVANIWITIGLVIGSFLLIGILSLIIWIIATNIYDKREFEKFCQQSKQEGYDVSYNPTYKDPCVNVDNPTYQPDN